jgi:histidine triad (HIT) family protein
MHNFDLPSILESMKEQSIFTKIINGEIPCYKIYEDEKTFAFLDIHPTVEGHVLIVPKTEVEFLWDLSSDDYDAVTRTVKKVALRLRDVLKKPYVGEMVVGTDVPHAHVHVMAFDKAHELKRTLESATAEPDHDALASIAKKLRFS